MTDSIQEIEKILLSSVLKHPDSILQIIDYLKPEYFSSSYHEIIFRAMEDLVKSNSEPTYLLTLNKLETTGVLDRAGGKEYLEELYNLQDTTENIRQLADVVIRAYLVRAANIVGYNLIKLNYNDQDNIEPILSQISQHLDNLLIGNNSGNFTESISQILRSEWDSLKHRMENPGITGISTGFQQLDLLISGLNPTDLILLAARPSVGKSAVAIKLMMNISSQGIPTLLFSYEMSKKQLAQRMVSIDTGINLQNIKTGAVTNDEILKIKDSYLKISNYPIFIDSNMSAPIGYVLSTIRKYVKTQGVKVVFIDYIQLMVHESDNETIELGKISRTLKMLAMELGITIVVLSQLNRGVEGRENKRPVLSDLRQSGRMEEDADIVMMLYRPALYGNVSKDQENLLEVLIRKNRNGPIGTIQLYFDPFTVNVYNSLAELINEKQKL